VHEVGDHPSRQIERAYQLAFQRVPTTEEAASCSHFLERGKQTSETTEASEQDEPAGSLTDLCLVLLNSNEFIYLQ